MREIILAIFCDVDEFCKGFEAYCKEHLLEANSEKKGFFPKSSMALSEIMTIVILFHLSQYRTFKGHIGLFAAYLRFGTAGTLGCLFTLETKHLIHHDRSFFFSLHYLPSGKSTVSSILNCSVA